MIMRGREVGRLMGHKCPLKDAFLLEVFNVVVVVVEEKGCAHMLCHVALRHLLP